MLPTILCLITLYLLTYKIHSQLLCPNALSDGVPPEFVGSEMFPLILKIKHRVVVEKTVYTEFDKEMLTELGKILKDAYDSGCFGLVSSICKLQIKNKFKEIFYQFLKRVSSDEIKIFDFDANFDQWNKNEVDTDNELDYNIQRFLLAHCLYYCMAISEIPFNLHLTIKNHCPNPCKQKDVCTGSGFKKGSCLVTEEGIFKHQYTCLCQEKYEWDPVLRGCVFENPCKSEPPVCLPKGTLKCDYNFATQDFRCFCRPEYMGMNCSLPTDACDELIKNPFLPNGGLLVAGNRACNVNNDLNRCKSWLHPDDGPMYSCICDTSKWTTDNTLRYDNCLQKITHCDQIICINGECVDSRDGSDAVCVCQPGYDSPMCATWTGVWSQWSRWGRCMPSCGFERWAVRTRNCLVEQLIENPERYDCTDSSIDYHRCEPHQCAKEEKDFLSNYFGIRAQIVMMSSALALLTGTGITLIWNMCFKGRIGQYLRNVVRHTATFRGRR